MEQSTARKLMKMTNELYEKKAESFSKTRNQIWEKEIIDFIENIEPDSAVLDLGCSNARLLTQIVSQITYKCPRTEIEYLGIDNSEKMIALNRKKYPDAEFRVGDGLTMRFKDKFDYVISVAVLHHIPSQELQVKFLKNIYNSLKTGGQMLISVWNRWQTKYEKYFIFGNSKQFNNLTMKQCDNVFKDLEQNDMIVPWKQSGYFRYIHAFKPEELKKLAQKTGFKNIKVFASKHGEKTSLKEALNIYLIGEK